MTINQITRMHNIHPMTIYKWRRKMHIIEDSLENLSAVLLENRTLKEENENLKKILGEMTMKKEIFETENKIIKKISNKESTKYERSDNKIKK